MRASQFAHYPFGGPDVEAVVKASQLLESGAGVTSNGAVEWVAVEDGTTSYVRGALVTGAYFEVLGIQPFLGRALTLADDVSGAENVLVISHGLWKRRYGASARHDRAPDDAGRRAIHDCRRDAVRARLSERRRGLANNQICAGWRRLR